MWISKSEYNNLVGRVKEIEREIKLDESVSVRGILFRSQWTMGQVVGALFKDKTCAKDVDVSVPFTETDGDGEEHESRKIVPLSDVVGAILKHCGIEIIPKHEVETTARKKKK